MFSSDMSHKIVLYLNGFPATAISALSLNSPLSLQIYLTLNVQEPD